MAKGCREQLNVDIAVSVTGVAGPGGGSPEKPVGTVWMGLATPHQNSAKLHNFPDLSRNKVRDYTCLAALETFLTALN
jgi:nicotinamide-nucleotide amidase